VFKDTVDDIHRAEFVDDHVKLNFAKNWKKYGGAFPSSIEGKAPLEAQLLRTDMSIKHAMYSISKLQESLHLAKEIGEVTPLTAVLIDGVTVYAKIRCKTRPMPCIINFEFLTKGRITCYASPKRMEPSMTICDVALKENASRMYVYGEGAGKGWNASGK